MTEPVTSYGANQPNELTVEPLMQQVAELVGEVTPAQAAAVIAAWHSIHDGDPVGMIRRDPTTGAIAVRAQDGPAHLWRVTVPATGEQYNDLQPTLPWPELIS